jgi:hypothetical protein
MTISRVEGDVEIYGVIRNVLLAVCRCVRGTAHRFAELFRCLRGKGFTILDFVGLMKLREVSALSSAGV